MAEKVIAELPEELVKELDEWAAREKMDKATLMAKIVEEGLSSWKMNKALEMYKSHKVTLWKSAEIAGVSLGEMLAELPKRGIPFQYDLDELKEDLQYAGGK